MKPPRSLRSLPTEGAVAPWGGPAGATAQESGFRPEAPMYLPAHFDESRPEVLQRAGPRASVRPAGHRRRERARRQRHAVPARCRPGRRPGRAARPRRPRQPGVERGAHRRASRWSSSRGRRATCRRPGIRARPSTARSCRPGTTSWCRARGPVRFVDDRGLAARLRHPADRGARGRPHGGRRRARRAGWAVSDAPDDYVETMLRAIVGVEIR